MASRLFLRRRPALTFAAFAILAVAACGGVQTADRAAPTAAAGERSGLPALDVVDLASGERVALAGLIPSERPTLVWLWAPH